MRVMGKNLFIALSFLLAISLSLGVAKLHLIHQLQVEQAALAAKAYEAELARAEAERAERARIDAEKRAYLDELNKDREKFFGHVELNKNVDTSDTVEKLHSNW